MASAKKKTTAKRATKPTVKYATKAQASAAHATQSTAHNAAHAGSEWLKKGAAEWQNGASEWAKNSAKMYQLPFGQNDAGDVAKNAAASVQSATENMMKMSSDWMSQMFGNMTNAGKKSAFSAEAFNPSTMFQFAPAAKAFDVSSTQEKMGSFTRESMEHMTKAAGNHQHFANEAMHVTRENAQTAAEVANTTVTISKEIGAEMMAYLNKMFAQNVELSKQTLSCRTLNDMFDLATRMMKTNLDGFFSESVKLSEMLFQCATDVSEPLNERVSQTTERLTRAMAA